MALLYHNMLHAMPSKAERQKIRMLKQLAKNKNSSLWEKTYACSKEDYDKYMSDWIHRSVIELMQYINNWETENGKIRY